MRLVTYIFDASFNFLKFFLQAIEHEGKAGYLLIFSMVLHVHLDFDPSMLMYSA